MRKICFITSTRADYGLLRHSMKAVEAHADFILQVVAMGMHLSKKFGETYKEIEKDKIEISKKIYFEEFEDSRLSMAKQTAEAMVKVSSALSELNPDGVIVLGDRYEIMGAAMAAFFLNIPIFHIHGGEVTQGAIDDQLRHCITKISTYHLTAAGPYRKRVLQLGEEQAKTFNIGAPGLENFIKQSFLPRIQLQQNLKFELRERNLLITFHPVTTKNENVFELINALKEFDDVGQIWTLPNSDAGYSSIINAIKEYAENKENVLVCVSLGQSQYRSLLRIVDGVVGNSSSGMIEAPFLGTPTLNIGDRQRGRIKPESVLNVPCEFSAIKLGLKKIFGGEVSHQKSQVFGDGNFSERFIKILEQSEFLVTKKFQDIKVNPYEC